MPRRSMRRSDREGTRTRPAAVAAFSISALGASVSHADTAKTQALEEITVHGAAAPYAAERSTSWKYTQRLVDIPKTVTIVTEELLRERNADSLQDGLRAVSGITLAAGEGGTPTGDQLFIRGFDARNDIMINGVRDIAGYTRDIYNVEAIEVAKGPGSAVYGRGATGGNVNLQTKTARLDEFTDLSLRGGSERDYRVTVDHNRALGDTTALRLNVLVDDAEVAGRDEVFNSKNALAVSFGAGIDTRSRFALNVDWQKQENLPDYGLPWVPNYSGREDRVIAPDLAPYEGSAPPADFANFYGNVYRDYENIKARSITARFERDLGANTTVRAQFRAGSVERQSVVTAPRFAFDIVDGVRVYGPAVTLADEKTRDTRDSLNVWQIDLIGHYETGSIRHDVVAGIERADEQFKRWNFVDLADDNLDSTPVLNSLTDPNPRHAFGGYYGRDGTSTLATGDTRAVYAFDTMTFTPQWQLTVGLRQDRFASVYQHDYADPSRRIEAVDEQLSWSAGIVYKPAANGTVYLGAGTSFNPSAEDLTASTRSNAGELPPEESISYELGTKWELADGRLFANFAVFRTEKLHARTDDPFDDGNVLTLDGRQRVEGIELGAVGRLTQRLQLSAGYTWQHSEVANAAGDDAALVGNALPRTPEHSLSLWAHFDLTDQWITAFGAQHIGDRFNSSDPDGRELAPGYTIYDLMVAYRLSDRVGLRFNARNLADERYIDRVGGGHFAPGEGRWYSLSGNLSF